MVLITERLNRGMQDAHKSLLEPTPTHNKFLARTSMDEFQDASLTPPSKRSLGKRGTTLLEEAKAKRDAKTGRIHGPRRDPESADIFKFNGSSDEEPDGESYTGVELQSSDQGKENGAQELPETLRNPRGSRPQGGSSNTIPTVLNSTPPQPFNSSAMRTISDREHHEPYLQSQSDERMPTPTTPSHSRSTASSTYKATQKEAMSQPPAVPNLHPDKFEAQQRPTSSGSAIASGKTTTINTGEHLISEAIDASQGSERAEPTSLPTFHTAGLLRPMVVLPEAQDDSLSLNQVSMPAPDVQITRTVKISDERRLKRHDQTAADDLGSDDISIGLPKEQYKPRPSRSRGTRNDSEIVVPTDYSKRPETVAVGKKERKQRKGKQCVSAEVTAETEREEEADEKDMDVSKSEVTLSEIEPPGSPTYAEDQVEDVRSVDLPMSKTETREIDGHSTQGSIRRGSKPKRQRGRPKKAADADMPAPRIEQGVREGSIKRKAHSASTNRKPAKGGQSKKSQSVVDSDSESEEENTKLAAKCDQPSEDPQSNVDGDSESEAVTSSKLSKRGHSGKQSHLVLDSDSEDEPVPPEEHRSQPHDRRNTGPESSALTESSGNHGNTKLTSKTTNNAGADQSETLPPVTPPKAAASTPKGPNKHSPISAGLSKYRVGLSKRARIEPLLRIVRK